MLHDFKFGLFVLRQEHKVTVSEIFGYSE